MTPRLATDNLSVRAQRDLTRLLVRSARDFGRVRAEELRDDILKRCRMIGAGQGLGHMRSDLTSRRSLRFWPVPPFVIVYDANTRFVVRVLHGRRDIPAVLR